MTYPLPREGVAPSRLAGRRLVLGWRRDHGEAAASADGSPAALARQLTTPLWAVARGDRLGVSAGEPDWTDEDAEGAVPVVGFTPAMLPDQLGDPGFRADHGVRYAYLSGAMANGIGSVDICKAMGQAGMLGFFGAAGLDPATVERAIDRIQSALGRAPYGVNLIHAPQEPAWEERLVDLLIGKRASLVEASAYLSLTPAVVRYRVHGIHEDALGRIVTPNQIIAKVSRVEVATRFFSPPPEKILQQLVAQGHISEAQAQMARRVPMAQDLTAEADSGGHTDNRPAIALLPTMQALRDQLQRRYSYSAPLRVGMAGGIATPASAAAAFAMGAAFVLAGSVHQACVESGSSDTVREMLAKAEQADTAMAPAADMFEMGVNLQVLKRGTMFPMRAAKLYECYRRYDSLETIPGHELAVLEKQIFRASTQEIWRQTRLYFEGRDPRQIERAERDPKHKMALVFRWYLGRSSGWANQGDPERKIDYQVWCGPAMGAFNEWVRGSFLEDPRQRRIVTVAQNILYGACVTGRLNSLREQGVAVGPCPIDPRTPQQLKEFFSS